MRIAQPPQEIPGPDIILVWTTEGEKTVRMKSERRPNVKASQCEPRQIFIIHKVPDRWRFRKISVADCAGTLTPRSDSKAGRPVIRRIGFRVRIPELRNSHHACRPALVIG